LSITGNLDLGSKADDISESDTFPSPLESSFYVSAPTIVSILGGAGGGPPAALVPELGWGRSALSSRTVFKNFSAMGLGMRVLPWVNPASRCFVVYVEKSSQA